MTDMGKYFHEQTKVEAARQDYNRAGNAFELAKINCRLAELKSQHEPLASLDIPRDKAYAAAYYVVIGRMPK